MVLANKLGNVVKFWSHILFSLLVWPKATKPFLNRTINYMKVPFLPMNGRFLPMNIFEMGKNTKGAKVFHIKDTEDFGYSLCPFVTYFVPFVVCFESYKSNRRSAGSAQSSKDIPRAD